MDTSASSPSSTNAASANNGDTSSRLVCSGKQLYVTSLVLVPALTTLLSTVSHCDFVGPQIRSHAAKQIAEIAITRSTSRIHSGTAGFCLAAEPPSRAEPLSDGSFGLSDLTRGMATSISIRCQPTSAPYRRHRTTSPDCTRLSDARASFFSGQLEQRADREVAYGTGRATRVNSPRLGRPICPLPRLLNPDAPSL